MAKIIMEEYQSPVVPVVKAPTDVEIAERAYLIYKARGGEHGQDLDDWLKAEAELLSERTGKVRGS